MGRSLVNCIVLSLSVFVVSRLVCTIFAALIYHRVCQALVSKVFGEMHEIILLLLLTSFGLFMPFSRLFSLVDIRANGISPISITIATISSPIALLPLLLHIAQILIQKPIHFLPKAHKRHLRIKIHHFWTTAFEVVARLLVVRDGVRGGRREVVGVWVAAVVGLGGREERGGWAAAGGVFADEGVGLGGVGLDFFVDFDLEFFEFLLDFVVDVSLVLQEVFGVILVFLFGVVDVLAVLTDVVDRGLDHA